ncbi:immunity 52 family protein [Myxococcus sp. AB025B]|uniref:immunity 52 family protein n=1 Tax=Myxococcus sp. AB025B TaxID=2562794 RepID=UPI0034CD80FB
MNETYYAGAYWGPREELPEACARRMAVLLTKLRTVAPSFAQWFQTGKSRHDALLRPIEPNANELEALVRRGKDRVVKEIGFRIEAWNGVGDDHGASSFRVTCGSYAARVKNACAFTLPSQGPHADPVLTASVLAGLLRASAVAWAPDWGVATSHALGNLMDARSLKGAPRIGWAMYLANHRGTVPPLPAPVRVEPVEDKGTLIILTPERFTASNPQHVALAEHVRELLDNAGLLKPLQP